MSDLISRSALLEMIKREMVAIPPVEKYYETFYHNSGYNCAITTAELLIKKQPPVEAVPVVHGEWKHKSYAFVTCSECGNTIDRLRRTNFCSNCGADMREKVWDG